MKKLTIVFALFFIALTAQANSAQSTRLDNQQRLVKAARFLEEKPFDKQAKEERAWAVKYASDTEDVTVIVCGGTGAAFLDKKVKFGSELVSQYLIAMTAFKLESPSKAADENAAQLAGVESALKAYEAMLKENPKAKAEKVEALLAKRNDGTLTKFVADADCGKK